MKRSLYRWCVNWWFDDTMPAWLQSTMNRDPELDQYRSELSALSKRLSDDADSWSNSNSVGSRGDSESSRDDAQVQLRRRNRSASRRHDWIIAASVAILFVGLWQLSIRSGPGVSPIAQPQGVVKPRSASGEVKALVAAVRSTIHSMEVSVSKLPESIAVPESSDLDLDSLRKATRQPIESVARTYGQSLAFFENSIREQIVNDSSDVRKLFQRRIP